MTHRKPRTTCPHTGDLMYDCRCGQCDTPLDATPATPPHTETNAIMDRLFKRIESKLTPKLNTGTAMDMLILVAEAMRELRAESTPHTEPPMNVNSQPDRFLSGMTVEQPMNVEQALRALKDAAYEWGGEPYDETVAPAVDALISAVRAEVLREIGQK